MKKNKKLLFFILTIIISLLYSCPQQKKYYPTEKAAEIVPVADKESKTPNNYKSLLNNEDNNKPFIKLKNYELLLKVINLNLDLDSQDEQIIIYKNRNDVDENISIAVADFNNVKNAYERLWNNSTLAQNASTFVVYIDDIIGDHDLEIICTGRNNSGNTTMDIFRKSNNSNVAAYTNIFNTSVHGTIDINQKERTIAYFQGLKNGISYTINVTNEDIQNKNKVLIKTVYYWDFPQKKYLLLSTETIKNETSEKKQISSIVQGGEKEFFEYISGPWYNDNKIIYFDPTTNNTVFYSNEIQESYIWQNTYKLLSTILLIRSNNEIINYIENEIYIKIESFDEISITVKDIDTQTFKKSSNEIWTGKYIRMNNEMKDNKIKKIYSTNTSKDLPKLNGQYLSDNGDILDFFGNEFYFKGSDESYNGGFAIYMANVPILGMKILKTNGTVDKNKIYKIDYSEETADQTLKRNIVLTPGKLSIHGFNAYDTVSLKFVQMETIEDDNSKE